MDSMSQAQEYKNLIASMLSRIDDERFLRQVYTILIRYARRSHPHE